MRTVMSCALCAALAGSAGCGGRAPLPERPTPIAYADTLPIREPAERDPDEAPRILHAALSGQVADVLGVRAIAGKERQALNLGHFDDVVNSAWFEHRNDRRPMSPEAVFRGPTTGDGPADGPLTVVAAKVQGISPGYTIEDTRGDRYVLKFDPKGFLYLGSAASVISNRLLYAAGYHVPEDYVFRFTTDRLRVDPDATVVGEDFIERPLTLQIARDALARTDSLPGGGYVAVASKFVPGVPKGPFFFEGVREDDPNDHYRHEHRRELRGLYVVSAWINHVDMRFMNTLDAFVEPGYLRHYLIDFAATLGSGTIRSHEPREGVEYNFDVWDTLGRLFTLGFHKVGWEDVEWSPIHSTIGWLAGEHFDPAEWKPNWPNPAFNNLTARDGYWGARLVGSFDEAQIRAAVAAGELPSEFAADTLAEILMTRRDRIVRYWYGKVSPVENPDLVTLPGGEIGLAFDDYGIRDGAWTAAETRYEIRLAGTGAGVARAGMTRPDVDAVRNGSARVEIELPPLPAPADLAVPVLEVRIVREGSGVEPRPARLYLRMSAEGYEIAGLEH